MFDIGWQEFILIALVAVVVVGPKDLPRVIRTVGQWIRKARSLASEFQGSLEEMAREAELDDVRKQIQQVSREGVGASIEKHVDPTGEFRKSFEEARESAGADEIETALDQARRDVNTLARGDDDAAPAVGMAAGEGGPDSSGYASLAERSRIPDNSVTPPAPAPAAGVPTPTPAGPSAAPAQTTTSASPLPAAVSGEARRSGKARRSDRVHGSKAGPPCVDEGL